MNAVPAKALAVNVSIRVARGRLRRDIGFATVLIHCVEMYIPQPTASNQQRSTTRSLQPPTTFHPHTPLLLAHLIQPPTSPRARTPAQHRPLPPRAPPPPTHAPTRARTRPSTDPPPQPSVPTPPSALTRANNTVFVCKQRCDCDAWSAPSARTCARL